MNLIKNSFLLGTYLWLRFDPIIYLTFRKDWTPRYEFMANIFGEKDTDVFLAHRVKLVKARNKKLTPIILISHIDKEIDKFMHLNPAKKAARKKKLAIIANLLFWATDKKINENNIDSYKTRAAIIDALTGIIFQNSLNSETELIFQGLKEISFSRITYLGAKGELSPVVHQAIISGVARILTAHVYEVVRARDEKLDKLTKVRLIKEIHKPKAGSGSLAFSADWQRQDDFSNKFPLPLHQVKLLKGILDHYRFSAWFEAREQTQLALKRLEKILGFPLDEFFHHH